MKVSKLHQVKKKKIGKKYIEINKKISYKIVQKTGIKNVTRFFLYNFLLIINLLIKWKPCNVLNINITVHFYVKNAFQFFSTIAKKLWYILQDLYEFFQILESGNFFGQNIIFQKRKVKQI